MNTSDMLKQKSSSKTAKENRIDRDNAMSDNEFEPGMEDEFADFFSDESEIEDDLYTGNTGSVDFNSQTNQNNGQSVTGQTMGTYQQQNCQPKYSVEDELYKALFEFAKSFFKGFVEFNKELIAGSKGLKARFWTRYGACLIKVSMAMEAIGVVLLVCRKDCKYDFLIGGVLEAIIGVSFLMFNYDRAKSEECLNDSVSDIPNSDTQGYDMNFQDDNIEFTESSEDDEPLFEDEESLFEDEIELNDNFTFTEPAKSTESVNYEDILESVDVTNGLYTRQYLYEKILSVMQSITPDYYTFNDIDENSDIFDGLNDIVVRAAQVICTGKDELPYLISASENLQFIKLTIKRTKNLKIAQLAEEIASIFKVDEDEGIIPEENEVIYATSLPYGDKVIVKIFKGDTSMVTIRDIVEKERDFFLDTKNVMPCVLGLDNNGKPVVRDFKDIESILTTGFPRSGKSWFILSVVLQLCMWNSPRDIQFIICDPKGNMSDFQFFTLPHVIKFVQKDEDIVSELRHLVREEADRRSSIIGGAKNVNIWDFKKKNPDVELPIIYVIVDEIVSLSDRMDKDTKSEFQGYLRELITRLPASGIRAFLIPHMIKNDIINKTTTDSIQCRISVNGDEKHIKMNVTERPFPYKLKRKGDMAVKLPDCEPKFVRSAVISDSNERNAELFEYIRKFWNKIEPDFISEVSENAETESKLNKLMNTSMDDEVDELDSFFSES